MQQIEPKHERIGFLVRILRQSRLVGRRHHLDHAGMGLRGGDIEKSDAAAGDAAYRDNGVKHARRMIVGGVSRRACDFENAVAASQRLADVRAMPDMRGRLRECDLRHG